jgi:hypothetical protein
MAEILKPAITKVNFIVEIVFHIKLLHNAIEILL